MSGFYCEVIGDPAPQGSKSPKGRTKDGRTIMVESCKRVKPWREAVVWAAREAKGPHTYDGPCELIITFYLPRPKSAPKRVTLPFRKPDVDKLTRSTCDALVTAGVVVDDARIVHLDICKVFSGCGGDALDVPGARIWVRPIEARKAGAL